MPEAGELSSRPSSRTRCPTMRRTAAAARVSPASAKGQSSACRASSLPTSRAGADLEPRRHGHAVLGERLDRLIHDGCSRLGERCRRTNGPRGVTRRLSPSCAALRRSCAPSSFRGDCYCPAHHAGPGNEVAPGGGRGLSPYSTLPFVAAPTTTQLGGLKRCAALPFDDVASENSGSAYRCSGRPTPEKKVLRRGAQSGAPDSSPDTTDTRTWLMRRKQPLAMLNVADPPRPVVVRTTGVSGSPAADEAQSG